MYHFQGLLKEYKRRYNKERKCEALKQIQSSHWKRCIWGIGPPSSFVQCMPDKYKIPLDPVSAYRAYYAGEKARFAKWKLGAPYWWTL